MRTKPAELGLAALGPLQMTIGGMMGGGTNPSHSRISGPIPSPHAGNCATTQQTRCGGVHRMT